MDNEQPEIWLQRTDSGESSLAYTRFWQFLMAGPKRSIRAVYRAECEAKGTSAAAHVPNSWVEMAQEHEWRRRAEAFDAAQRAIDLAELQAAREKARKLRMGIIGALQGLLAVGIADLQAAIAGRTEGKPFPVGRLSRLTSVAKTVLEQSRIEHGEPATITGITDGNPVEALNDAHAKLERLLDGIAAREIEDESERVSGD